MRSFVRKTLTYCAHCHYKYVWDEQRASHCTHPGASKQALWLLGDAETTLPEFCSDVTLTNDARSVKLFPLSCKSQQQTGFFASPQELHTKLVLLLAKLPNTEL